MRSDVTLQTKESNGDFKDLIVFGLAPREIEKRPLSGKQWNVGPACLTLSLRHPTDT